MTRLLDIAPQRVKVDVLGHEVEVGGLTLGDIAQMLRRFPALRGVFAPGTEITMEALLEMAGAAIGPIIAAGLGHLGSLKHETWAAALPLEAQANVIGPIKELTMPSGIGPFVEKVAQLFGLAASTLPGSSPGASKG